MFVYLDTGVTPDVMKCSNCSQVTAQSCKCRGEQPGSVWYRPKNLTEVKQVMEDAYKHDEEFYIKECEKQGISKKELKRQILNNYIKHHNEGGLFSKERK